MLQKLLNNIPHQKSNEIRASWKSIRGKHVGNSWGEKDSVKETKIYEAVKRKVARNEMVHEMFQQLVLSWYLDVPKDSTSKPVPVNDREDVQ